MGRRPLPAKLHLLKGTGGKTAGKRRLRREPPALPPGIPPCPKHLRGLARETWNRIGQQLAQLGVVTAVDQDALELLVRAYVELRKAQAVVDRLGMTFAVRTASGRVVRQRPEVAIAADAWRRIKAALVEFALTPASRARLEVTPPANQEDPFEQFLFGELR